MYQRFYSQFLAQNKGIQHFACHSHYYWPDVTRQAMLDYWDDSARLVDRKWDYFFSVKIPEAQAYISKVLGTSDPSQIVFAPNTHEFVVRLLSCFEPGRPVRILTTDSEFHSFRRQIDRLSEYAHFQIDRVSTQPFESFEERFISQFRSQNYDLVFLSHVFFNSGVVSDICQIINQIKDSDALIAIDGYHAFMAIPVNIQDFEHRIFYLAGSYKYAQGGEGCCFMHVPVNQKFRPWNTGWFAHFDSLNASFQGKVEYAENAYAFAGATMDFSPLYRLLSVFRLFEKENISIEKIQNHIRFVQKAFLEEVSKYDHPLINKKRLIFRDLANHGHFFSFQLDSAVQTSKLAKLLEDFNIITDFRNDRIRFGFALYHDGNYDLSVLNTRRAYFFDEFLFS
ncbi:MAG: aminotransferase class V-fold PLP-dependent enzyme [Sphingobacteriales bacterium]|nr:aminotransferase class V-fold PLP-dependent enzyme [Sphingobacteriales bacterium]